MQMLYAAVGRRTLKAQSPACLQDNRYVWNVSACVFTRYARKSVI